jgi:hypothetical protein
MVVEAPGRNEPCPCGSGQKFKRCCLAVRTAEDSALLRLRAAEGRVVNRLLHFIATTWGEPLVLHAWEDFWNYDDVPEDLDSTPEFDPMFVPWLVLGFVPDAESDDAAADWPTQPIGLEWVAEAEDDIADLDRAYIDIACRSPLSVFVVEQVTAGRSLDLKDVLTGARFHVLERSASTSLLPADLIFMRVVTIDGISLMFGVAPFVVPPRWHTRIIDWREKLVRKRLMTRQDLAEFDTEIRELYFDIAAELLDPPPPRLCNTDGDPIALTTLTYTLSVTVGEAFDKLAPLARVHDEDHCHDVIHDASGAVRSVSLAWVKAGNRRHKHGENTILGMLRLDAGRLVADVNSTRRADQLKRQVARRLGQAAVLIDTTVVDPTEAIEERDHQRTGEPGVVTLPESSGELEAIQHKMTRHEWNEWVDTRVPALGNKTPRQASRTAAGREKLEALLSEFARYAADGPSDDARHIATIRATLGLEKR